MYRRHRPDLVPYPCPGQLMAVALRRSCHGLAPARLAVLSVGWCPPPPNESGSSAIAGASLRRCRGSSHLLRRPQRVESEVTARRSLAAPGPLQPYTLWLASDYRGTWGCSVERFCPWRHRPTRHPRSAEECKERRRCPAKTCIGRQGCPVKGKEMKSSAERLSYHDAVELG